MTDTKHVGIWIRVSTDMQVKDDSPEHHEQRARYYTQAKGWEVMEVYRLDAVSGKAVMAHHEAQRMLKDIKRGHITGLVFSKLARLARSTKELLEFADYFRTHGADLISLSENIDTSTPAGRLFFTIISAMAEWEREEIASRVAASVPIRAKLGKPLGGQASFGYRWQGKELVIDETEAPVRKLLHELFIQHQRKKTTAKALNDRGYRTRNGTPFSDTTVDRLLRDPTAKGERIANYTKSLGDGKQWVLKPETEWIRLPCPAIVSESLWNQCNQILDEQGQKRRKPGPKTAHLLSGLVKCSCGKTMYVYHASSRKYQCTPCKNSIAVEDIDEIYLDYVKGYLAGVDTTWYTQEVQTILTDVQERLAHARAEQTVLTKKLGDALDKYMEGMVSAERFKAYCDPFETQLAAVEESLPELEATVAFHTTRLSSIDTVLHEAQALYDSWPTLSFDQQRAIVETITEQIEIDTKDITITLAYLPSLNSVKWQHNFRGS